MLNAAIIGLAANGITRGATACAENLAVHAVLTACQDAGVEPETVDGLIVCRSGLSSEADLGLSLQRQLALRDLRLLHTHYAEGASTISAIQVAAMAVSNGLANCVAIVFADAPLKEGISGRTAFSRSKDMSGVESLRYGAGLFGGAAVHALAAALYMERYSVKPEEMAHVAISARRWAALNPDAVFKAPIDVADYLAAPFVIEPLRVLDCAAPVNGGIAVLVSHADAAADCARPPVYIRGFAQCHPGQLDQRGFDRGLSGGGRVAGALALRIAGITRAEIDFCEIYDAFSYMTLVTLEDYGFCGPGEAAAVVAGGVIAPGGALPVNTGGGHLSGFYMQGMTPVHEAVVQLRGAGGERQLAKRDFALVTNEGGRLDHHANLILSPHRSAV